jgi:nucleoside-diphosphate-sugar epimerase
MLLITGANQPFVQEIIAALPANQPVRAFDAAFDQQLGEGQMFHQGDLRDPAAVAAALDGVGAVIHMAPSGSPADSATLLDQASRGTYQLLTQALDIGIKRFVIGSTLRLFHALPADWRISAAWRPQPQPETEQLAAWLSELSARELVRAKEVPTQCLRFGQTTAKAAAEAIMEALIKAPAGWSVSHLGTRPHAEPTRYAPVAGRTIQKVVIFGAGGPLAAAAARELAPHYQLRLTDVQPLEKIIAAGPRPDQPAGAPIAALLAPPHETTVADVTNYDQVLAACVGMDAIINCTVVRHNPIEAFRVNTLGAYHIARAAVAQGIKRIVHTGPQQASVSREMDYSADYDLLDELPPRPGRHLYCHSKYLGQELCRIFAQAHQLEVPVLLFSQFLHAEQAAGKDIDPLTVTWADAARAIRAALAVSELPSPYEVFTINADLPHGVFSNHKARKVLNWQPQEDLSQAWK